MQRLSVILVAAVTIVACVDDSPDPDDGPSDTTPVQAGDNHLAFESYQYSYVVPPNMDDYEVEGSLNTVDMCSFTVLPSSTVAIAEVAGAVREETPTCARPFAERTFSVPVRVQAVVAGSALPRETRVYFRSVPLKKNLTTDDTLLISVAPAGDVMTLGKAARLHTEDADLPPTPYDSPFALPADFDGLVDAAEPRMSDFEAMCPEHTSNPFRREGAWVEWWFGEADEGQEGCGEM